MELLLSTYHSLTQGAFNVSLGHTTHMNWLQARPSTAGRRGGSLTLKALGYGNDESLLQ